jgi:hypothetical protein
MGMLSWITGTGAAPAVEHPRNGSMVEQRWSRSGVYLIRALYPLDRLRLRFQLASMLGRETLEAMHAVMSIAAGVEDMKATNMRQIYDALRKVLARGEPLDRAAVERACGDLWAKAQGYLLEVMPDENVLDLGEFMIKTRPLLAAIAPVLGAIEPDAAMDIVRWMLIVRENGGAGLYVRDQPMKDERQINAIVPHDEIEGLAWWALLFNIRPFTPAGESTSPFPGQSPKDAAPTARTRSTPGPTGVSSTSTTSRPPKSTR